VSHEKGSRLSRKYVEVFVKATTISKSLLRKIKHNLKG